MHRAQRMHGAAHRKTTRPEDTAYCLLGIFDINMPLLYGEGDRAFKRLQEEIIKKSTDDSIFAWTTNDEWTAHWGSLDILAPSPEHFEKYTNIKCPNKLGSTEWGRPGWIISNRGLELRTCLEKALDFPQNAHAIQGLGDLLTNCMFLRLRCYHGEEKIHETEPESKSKVSDGEEYDGIPKRKTKTSGGTINSHFPP